MTQAYPLYWPEGWPRTPHTKRQWKSKFNTTFTKARAQLFSELNLLGAKHVVVSSWLALRNDGLPLASAARQRIPDPGVAVYFMFHGKQMVLARDEYDTPHDNLRSIGLSIAGLRQMERHGGAHMMDRAFEGFAALPSQSHWRTVLGIDNSASLEIAEARYRELAKTTHPDRGGDPAEFNVVTDAIRQAREELRQ